LENRGDRPMAIGLFHLKTHADVLSIHAEERSPVRDHSVSSCEDYERAHKGPGIEMNTKQKTD
jgi:hypothetical protein